MVGTQILSPSTAHALLTTHAPGLPAPMREAVASVLYGRVVGTVDPLTHAVRLYPNGSRWAIGRLLGAGFRKVKARGGTYYGWAPTPLTEAEMTAAQARYDAARAWAREYLARHTENTP